MRPISAFTNRVFLVCLVLHLSVLKSSAQGLIWAQGNVGDNITAVTTDGNNNGYFVGTFSGTVDFDPGPGVQNLTAVGDFDMFILKKDATGNLLWAKHVTTMDADTGICSGNGIELDDLGNIYICGSYRDSFDFDPGPGVYLLSTYSDSYNGFVLKLSPSGDYIWAKSIGSETTLSNFSIQDLKVDAAANVFFTCRTHSNTLVNIDVDPGLGVHNISCTTDVDILMEKLDSAGNFIWARQISGLGNQNVSALALDTASNVYITGKLAGTADFDPGPGVASLSTNYEDIFMAKYDFTGNYQWAEQLLINTPNDDCDIATDTFGNVIVTGPGFVRKRRSDGTIQWLNGGNYGSYYSHGGTTVAADGMGNIYTAFDGIVHKTDSTGNMLWAKYFPGPFAAITLDQANNVYVVGYGSGDINPHPDTFNIVDGGLVVKLCGESLALTTSDDTLCPAGQSAQLSTPFIPGATYKWIRNGFDYAFGGNTITVSDEGIYEVFVNGGCPSASGFLHIYNCVGYSLGVGETKETMDIRVYPNPFEDVLTVKGLQVTDQLNLIDITGRVVHRWQGTLPIETFTTGDLSPGYYILKVMNEHGVVRVNVPVVKR